MKSILLVLAMLLALSVITECRGPGHNTPTDDTTDDEDEDTTNEDPTETSAIREQVLAMVQQSNCPAINSFNCGDDAESYYEEFDYFYNGEEWKIIITSGVPDHLAENKSTTFCTAYLDVCQAINPDIEKGSVNPNEPCERWQYVLLPKNPNRRRKGEFGDTSTGTIGFATSGGHIYNHRANLDGDVAWYDEIQSFDLSMGHSDPDGSYHYHGVPYLIPNASDPQKCTIIGYLLDGFPVYGLCADDVGNTMISCYKLIDGKSGENEADYEFDEEGYAAETCNLDEANGKKFADGYGYVTTTNYPGVPIFYSGQSISKLCGFCPEGKEFC